MLSIAVINMTKRVRRVFFVTVETKKETQGKRSWRDNYRRVHFIGDVVEAVLQTLILSSNVFACLEAGSFGSKGSAVTILAEVGHETTSRLMSILKPTSITKAAPQSWKAALMHDVNWVRGKSEAIEYLIHKERRLKGLTKIKNHHNLFDAYGMALVMERILTAGPENKSQKKILEGLNVTAE